MQAQAAAGTHWGSIPTKRVWASMLKGKKDRGCLFFPAAPSDSWPFPALAPGLFPINGLWPVPPASCRLPILLWGSWAAQIGLHRFITTLPDPKPIAKAPRQPRPGFTLPTPNAQIPKKNKIPLGPEQLCQECSRGLPAKNMNSSSNTLDSLSVFLLPLGFIYLCWFCFDSKPWQSSCLLCLSRMHVMDPISQ